MTLKKNLIGQASCEIQTTAYMLPILFNGNFLSFSGRGGLSLNQVNRAMTIFCPGVCSRPGIEAGKGARPGQSLMTTCFFYDLLGQKHKELSIQKEIIYFL